MRSLLIFVCLVLGTTNASPSPVGCTHLFVAAGQSNMEGHGWPYQIEDITADARIWDTNYTSGSPIPGYERYEGLGVAGSLSGATTYRSGPTFGGLVSPKGTFLRAYADNYTGPCRIMVTSCAFGGTGFIADSGNCPSPTGNMTSRTWDRLGSCRQTCVNRVAAVFSNTAMNGNVTVRAILWHQGEFNTGGTSFMNFSEYTAAMLQLIDDWRGLNGQAQAMPGTSATTPFIVGSLNWNSFIYSPSVSTNVALAYLQFNRTNVGYAHAIGIWYQALHFSGPDSRTLGARYYNEYLRITTGTVIPAMAPPTPNCTGAVTVSGIPAGTRAFYPLDGRLDDCGPNGLLPLVSDPGYNQTVRYGVGPYPRNSSLSLYLGLLSSGFSPMIVYDPQAFDRLYPITLIGPSNTTMPMRTPDQTVGWINSNQSMTASLWIYQADAYNLFVPLQFNGITFFARGRPGDQGMMGSLNGIAGCAYNYDHAIPFPVRRWMHLVHTHWNSTMSIYVDGVLVKSYRDCQEPLDMRNSAISLGRRLYTIDSELYIQWFRVYDRILSASEVSTLYAAENVNVSSPSPFVSRSSSTYRYTFDGADPLAEATGGTSLLLRNGIPYSTVVDFQMRFASASSATLVSTPSPYASGAISGQALEQYLITDSRVVNLQLPEPMLQWSVCMGVYLSYYNASGCPTFGLEYDARPDSNPSLVYAPTFRVCANNTWTYTDNSTITWTGNGTNATGIWHHLCVTMDYAQRSNFTVYYNGAARGSGSRGNMTARPALLGLPLDVRLTLDNVWMKDSVATPTEILTEYLYSTVSISQPTAVPTPLPTPGPGQPTLAPTPQPSTATPSSVPSPVPSAPPTSSPTRVPSIGPSATPTTAVPTATPTRLPTPDPLGASHMCHRARRMGAVSCCFSGWRSF